MKLDRNLKILYGAVIIVTISLAGLLAVMQGFSSSNSTDSTESLTALNSYLYIDGETQGQIVGGVDQAGREGSSYIYQMSQNFEYGAKGTVHTPIFLTKPIDKASPLLFTALDTHELLQVTIHLWKPDSTGKELQYYTIELVDAYLNSIHYYQKDNRNPDYMPYEHMEEISFVYSKITFTFTDGGITGQGNWNGSP